MSEKVSLYNPRDTPPEQLEAMLTGREPLLKEVLDSLREQVDAPTRQHWLLRGPRGIGKTHLTGIIHHRVQSDPALVKAYLPLWLGEADVYEVYSPATLLLRIGERLIEALPDAELARTLHTLEGNGDEDALFEELAAHLTEEAERQGRVLLVLMENLDALFESFAPKQRTAQTRQLRSLLLGNPRFLFVSTTPTRYLKEMSDPKAPLFAQLKERKLAPLKVEEVGALFTKLTQLTGRNELLGQGSEARLRQRIIHQLTGGLPRSVVMAFGILRDKEGIQALVEDLRSFLDAQTAYFEARLSRLAPRERAIVTTMALADQNLTLKELAEKSRLQEKSLSTLVARLEQEGHLEAVEGTGGKGALYGLSEGLFRIWYQYRKGRLLLEPLVRFLAYWYEPDELQDVVESMRQRRIEQTGHATKLALLQVEAAFQIATSDQGRAERQRIWKECREAVQQGMASDPIQLEPELEQRLSRGLELLVAGRHEEGRSLLDEIVATHTQGQVGKTMAVLGYLFKQGIQSDGECISGSPELLQWMMDRFGTHSQPGVKEVMSWLQLLFIELLRGLGRYDEALVQIQALLPLIAQPSAPMSDPMVLVIHQTHAMVLNGLRRHREAREICERLLIHLRLTGSALDRAIRVQTLDLLSRLYEIEDRIQEHEAALRELVEIPLEAPKRLMMLTVALAKFRLICIQFDNHPEQTTSAQQLEEWYSEHRELLSSLSPEDLEPIELMRSLAAARHRGEAPSNDVIRNMFRVGLKNDPILLARRFLKNAAVFIQHFPNESRTWVEHLLTTDIPESQKQQLRLHLQVLDILATNPRTPARLRQKLKRVPIELQALFKELISKMDLNP